MSLLDQRTSYSKEAIRQRLLLNIMHMWGVEDVNLLDPFVRMLTDTVANEIHRISHDFIGSEVRVLEKMADLLTPDLLIVPRPAHAIAKAHPSAPVIDLQPDESFFYQERFSSKALGELDSRHNLFFSAVDPVRLFDGCVVSMVSNANLYLIDKQLGKRLMAKGNQKLPPHSVWLGLKMNTEISKLDQLTFYFDWPTDEKDQQLCSLLGLSSWRFLHQPIATAHGPFFNTTRKTNADLSEQLLSDFEISNQIENDIRQTYHNRFIHITQADNDPSLYCSYPTDFETYFGKEPLAELYKEPLLWLHVSLPAHFNESLLDELMVSINTFPVINRKENQLTYRTRPLYYLLPLRIDPFETLLTVRRVGDSKGNSYSSFPLHLADQFKKGSYAVRRGGVERFDQRNAREQLSYLQELLRDESAAFAAYGQDVLQSLLVKLQEKIDDLDRQLYQAAVPYLNVTQYVVFKPIEEGETMQVNFWTTNCQLANGIPAGTRLQAFNTESLLPDTIILMTNTLGGKNRNSALHRVKAYRYALMTHERLVTFEDINAFLEYELGDLISTITIKKGVDVGRSTKEGLMRTVDIILQPSFESDLNDSEWTILLEGIRQKLISRSGHVIQYRLSLAKTT